MYSPAIKIIQKPEKVEEKNIAPFFAKEPEKKVIPMYYGEEESPVFPVFLPEIVDLNENDTVTISIKPKRDYIKINQNAGILGFSRDLISNFLEKEDFEITLTDQKGAFAIS